MTVGQKVWARFTTFSALAEHERPKKDELYRTPGGNIVESFRPDEVWT